MFCLVASVDAIAFNNELNKKQFGLDLNSNLRLTELTDSRPTKTSASAHYVCVKILPHHRTYGTALSSPLALGVLDIIGL